MEDNQKTTFLAWRFLAGAFFVFASILLSGCFKQFVSKDDLPENRESNGHGKLLVPGLGVIIRSSNETPRSWIRISRDFEITTWFAPTRPGFQFDPQRVRLVFPDGKVLTPMAVFTVSDASDPSRAHTTDCWSNRRLPIEGKPPYPLKIGYCFEMFFDIRPPAADVPFTMHIDGLTHDGKPVSVPEIRFNKGSFWVWDFLGL